jgi:ferredoxin-NADP reductase
VKGVDVLESYETRVLELTACGNEILTVRLERPKGYEFVAGQWFRLTIPTAEGPQVRTFTHAAAPKDDWIELTTRGSASAFKVSLAALEQGSTVQVSGAGGRLRLPTPHDRIAFLAGGVGITPVRSLLRDAVERGEEFADAALIYGNRDATCEPYIDEFLAMADAGVRTIRVLENPPLDWAGESGFITGELVRRWLDPKDGRCFFVTGPPVMVAAMRRVLDEIGVAGDRVLVEAFGSPTSH